MLQHLLQRAISAHSWISFSPERRGKELNDSACIKLEQILSMIPAEHHQWVKEKYERLYSAYLSSLSRTASSMITGPANFPVARQEKYRRWAENKYDEWTNFYVNVVDRITKPRPEKITIDLELIQTENKIEEMTAYQEAMKAANKIFKNKKLTLEERNDELNNLGLSDEDLKSAKKGGWWGIGFAPFELTNNLNRLKTAKDRLIVLQRRIDSREQPKNEYDKDGVRVVENIEADRLQLFFDGIPDKKIREQLKSNGFKWSPSNGCWQTFLRSGKDKIQKLNFK